jgi:DNA-binding NarL/FixJ family response regulator
VKRGSVLLADDHALVAEGLRRILETEFEIAGMVADGKTLVEESLRLKPDVILVDISLPVVNGIEAARQIMTQLPGAKIVFLTMHSDLTYLRLALGTGASGYVLKQSGAKELLTAVREVLAGRKYVSAELADNIPDPQLKREFEPGTASDLTARQREILSLIARGRSNSEIAAELNITIRTVRFHRAEISRKLGVSGTAALTRYAIAHGYTRE